MEIFKFKPKSESWLAKRSQYITATEVCSLFGMDPYKSANKLKATKIEPEKIEDNVAMKKGRLLEPVVLVHLTELGLPAKPVDPDNVVMVVDDEHRLAASLDGKINTDTGFYLVECKSTRPDLFDKWFENPPIKYLMQVQTQLAVTNTTCAILACVDSSDVLRFIAYEVQANPAVQELIKKESKRFWECFDKNKTFKFNHDYRELLKYDVIQGVRLIFS